MGKSLQARAKKSSDQKIGSFIAVICLVVLYIFLFLLDNALPSNSTTIMLVTVLKKGAILCPGVRVHEPAQRVYGPVLPGPGGLYAHRRLCLLHLLHPGRGARLRLPVL